MADRYYSHSPISGGIAVLDGPEAHHLAHVMRAKPGTEVVLFDGSGFEFDAEIVRVGRSEVELAVRSSREVDRELPMEVTLAVTLPKGDRQRWLVEKATELGIARIVPLQTTRSADRTTPQVLKRLQRTVIEASKQCGRNRLLEITPSQSWAEFVGAGREVPIRILAHPDATGDCGTVKTVRSGPVALAVGPEGGFTEAEVALATDAGWQAVALGPRILRVETAAVLLTAMVTP
ncbi:MAG: 16S rRNA (uracil(1498)-N(3))-methyltransferase [Thermoguttaceae bacterium]